MFLTPTFRFAMLILLVIVAAFMALTGCATLRDPKNSALIEITTQVAVSKFIESKSDRAGTAAHVRDVATQIKSVAESDATTVGALQTLASARIAQLNLRPSDVLLATALVNVLVAELQDKVSAGVLSDADRVLLGKVLGTVIATANVYTVPATLTAK